MSLITLFAPCLCVGPCRLADRTRIGTGGDKDNFIRDRYPLLRRGLSLDGWQQQSVPALQGAFWQCFAPWDSKGTPQNPGFPGFHMCGLCSGPGSRCLTPSFHGVCRAHFIQHLNHVWVCDSGKIGAFYLQLDKLTEGGDAELVSKAIAAGEFLLRMQLPSGDLSGSVYNTDNGTVTHGSNCKCSRSLCVFFGRSSKQRLHSCGHCQRCVPVGRAVQHDGQRDVDRSRGARGGRDSLAVDAARSLHVLRR